MQKMCIKIKNKKEPGFETSISLEDCIQIIKSCLNARLVNIIKDYIGLFGIPLGEQHAMFSDSIIKLCNALMAYITEQIQPSGYTDIETQIDAVTGNEILKRKKLREKQKKDQDRYVESKKI